jgi:hypothetical protein
MADPMVQPKLTDAAQALYGNQREAMQRNINMAMINLTPDKYSNFNAITSRYPNITKDLVMSMVQQGLTVNTPGLGKITSIDGINQLKNDALNVDKIKSSVKKDRGIVGSILDSYQNAIYDPFKGAVRVGFALLRQPYDFVTTLSRDAYAISQGEEGAGQQYLKDLATLGGKSTLFGSLVADVFGGKPGVNTGSGFFMNPETGVGKDQALAMGAYGKINGKSYTIGRSTMKSLGSNPDSTGYRITSGIIDATLNILTDPSTWFGPGAVGKVLTQGKKVSELKAITAPLGKEGSTKAVEDLRQEGLKAARKANKEISNIRTRYADEFLKEQQLLQEQEAVVVKAYSKTVQTLLNTEENLFGNMAKNSEASRTLAPDAVAKWLITNPKTQTGELTKGVDRLSADAKNTGGFFDGYLILDEVPTKGSISVGAHGLDEYAVTAITNAQPKLLDLGDDFATASTKDMQKEGMLRSFLADAIEREAGNFDQSPATRQVFDDLWKELKTATAQGVDPVTSLALGGKVEPLGIIIGKVAQTKNPEAMSKVSDMIQEIWKVDGFSNIRSIYGDTGGVVITNSMKFLAANKAEIASAASEILDPTNLGPNAMKLIQSMRGTEDAIAATKDRLIKAEQEQAALERRIKDVSIFRQYADQDPELLAKIINDPEYKGLDKLINLNAKVGDKDIEAEFYRAEIGLTKDFAGKVTGDFGKVLKFMLGPHFAQIAEVVARETDPVRLRQFFGRKLDAEMVVALTAAKTTDDVFKIFLEHMGHETTDPNIFKSMSLRKEANQLIANPLAKLVDPVSLVPLKFAESIERSFNRYFVRSTTLNLGDLTGLTNGVEDWLSSTGLSSMLGKRKQEQVITNITRKLLESGSKQERGAIIEKTMAEIVETIGSSAGMTADEISEIRKVVKFGKVDREQLTAYSVNKIGFDEVPRMVFTDGQVIELPGAMHEFQLLEDMIHLPDSKEVMKVFNNYQKNQIHGKLRAGKVAIEELGDVWRTAQLVFRAAYIFRNVAEMQMRSMFSGHVNAITHPFQFIAMVMANPNTTRGKLASRVAKYQYDLSNTAFKNVDAEGEFLDGWREFQIFAHRSESVSDYRGNKASEVFKIYQTTEAGGPNWIEGLAYTLNRFASDRLNPDIAKLIIAGDEKAQRMYVNDLIKNFDTKDNIIKEYVLGAFKKNEGLKRIFLKDSSLGDEGNVAANLDPEKIFTFFFDANQKHTLAGQIKTVAGNGPKSHLILQMIATGKAQYTSASGKVVTLTPPWKDGPRTSRELISLEKNFAERLGKIFNPEDLAGSRVLVENKAAIARGSGKKELDKAVDWFFDLATRMESKYNFGPEYQMSYWDFVGRYARMLNTEDLKYVQKQAVKSLAPLRIGNKQLSLTKHPVLRVVDTELKKRLKDPTYNAKATTKWQTIHQMSARNASEYVKDLFYDASRQRQWANAWRLIFPFAQAQNNTIYKWGQLAGRNPIPAYRFGKAYNSLNQKDSNVIYDATGMTYDDDQGFFYKEPGQDNAQFKMPIVGSIIGALAGRNIDMKDALQITAPVQSLNLAFGQVNPVLPGIGPAGQFLFTASGKNAAFGPTYDVLRDIITPFGEPQNISDIIFPAWIKKTVLYRLGDKTTVQRGVKDWASYLASTGKYGDNPLASDAQRTKLFHDAESMSREIGVLTALFQSISPATPSTEVLAKIKNPENKMNFMTQTILYDYWDKVQKANPGDYGKAVTQFANMFGEENLMITLSGTTGGTTAYGDAWNFLNNNPEAADKYARSPGDVVPYFFPGGEFSMQYYNWQKKTGSRRPLSVNELQNEAEDRVYAMMKSRISDQQIAGNLPNYWYVDQIAKLDKQFGARPPSTITSNTAGEKIARIGMAIQDPAFKQSPIYNETVQFYAQYQEFQDLLNKSKVSNYAELKGKSGYATMMRNGLIQTAQQLIANNPSFSRMYYGVFAGQLEG